MNPYLSSSSLKSLARGQLLGHYGTVAGAYFVHMVCILPLTMAAALLFAENTLINLLLSLTSSFLISLLSGFFIAGESYIYLKLACNQPVTVSDLFYGFHNDNHKIIYIQAVLAGISLLCTFPAMILGFVITQTEAQGVLTTIYYILYAAGLIVNLILSLMLSQVYFLMLDYAEYTPKQILQKSIQLMKKKNLGRLFYIQISFVPLVLLGYLSCGIGLLWVQPYMQATEANFYLDMIKKRTA